MSDQGDHPFNDAMMKRLFPEVRKCTPPYVPGNKVGVRFFDGPGVQEHWATGTVVRCIFIQGTRCVRGPTWDVEVRMDNEPTLRVVPQSRITPFDVIQRLGGLGGRP